MAFPDHLLTLATLRLLTLTPLSSSYTASSTTTTTTTTASAIEGTSNTNNDRFHSVRSQPLHILSELTAAYLHLLGNAAKSHAEQAGRTCANAIDAREAIKQYGGSIDEVDEWARECQLDRGILSSNDHINDVAVTGGGGGGRADDANDNDLGALLKDTARNVAYHPPAQVLEYAPLTDREAAIVEAVQHNDSLLPFLPIDIQQQVQLGQSSPSLSSSSSQDNDDYAVPSPSSSRATSPPPPSYNEAITSNNDTLSLRKREKQRAHDDVDENDDPLSFLPPFPDLDATQASLQTIIEDESGRIVKRARRALDTYLDMRNTGGPGVVSISKKNAALPWLRPVPYEASSLAEYEGGKFSVPSMKKDISARRRPNENGQDIAGEEDDEAIQEEEDAFTVSSLPYFLETFNWVSLDYEQQGDQALLPLRHNSKRKRAATAIHSNILNPSDDSLSGSIPALPPRHAKKQAGWIPYPPINPDISDPSEPGGKAIRPFPMQLHPFSTQLPASITEPVPQLVLPHASKVLAPPMHPRYPTAHTSIRTLLESSSPALFGRTTRMGPPGPLLDNGAAGFYQVEAEKPVIPGWPGDAMPRMMGWNFDWEIGNELEDGIKERKLAGIEDVAVHEPSSSLSAAVDDKEITASNGDGTSTTIKLSNGASTSNSIIDHYKGPAFPSLPTRPTYDPQQALQHQHQREQERKNEEAELTFQEVQEDKESDERIKALENARLAEEEEKEKLKVLKLQQREEAARVEVEEASRKRKELADEEKKRKEKEQIDKPKIVPKLSFSLKLGGGGGSTASAAPASTSTSAPTPAPTPALLPAPASALASTPSSSVNADQPNSVPAPALEPASITQDTPATGTDTNTMDFEEIGGQVLSASAHPASTTGAQSTSGAVLPASTEHISQNVTMWTPGTTVEQDYRAPAADITSLSQPPIIEPGGSESMSSASPPKESSEVAAPAVSEHTTSANPADIKIDAQEEGAEEGEEDAENESEEDDLFDEVEVDEGNNESGVVMEGDAVYAASPAYQDTVPGGVNNNEMHVEVEEMDM